VTARVGDGRLRLEVRDDGRGADRAPGDGAGLAGMRERAGLLGGELTVRTAPGEGFALDADLPARLEDGPAPR
jgi:signal transduction histidine kinase